MTLQFKFPNLEKIEKAAGTVYGVMPPTLQYCWPLLNERLGTEVWLKHENHTPIGSFKVRGGICYLNNLAQSMRNLAGVVAATRGNHGQSIGFAAQRQGLAATIVVSKGNSVKKQSDASTWGHAHRARRRLSGCLGICMHAC